MPNIWTHVLFAEEVAKHASLSFHEQDKKYFFLGAQGPDPFFYHNFYPWRKKPVTAIGQKIHMENCGPFLVEMIIYGKKYYQQAHMRAYILGYISHHFLDRTTHPYIHYRSGLETGKHSKLEIIIDTLLMKSMKQIDTAKIPVYREIYIGPKLDDEIKTMMTYLIENFFPEIADEMPAFYIEQSYTDMIQALKILFDPIGWKNKLLSSYISNYSYEKSVPNQDFLNEERSTWKHPAIEDETSSETFIELFELALEQAGDLFRTVLDYWEDPHPGQLDKIKSMVGNISYDTGKDCTLSLNLNQFDPIL